MIRKHILGKRRNQSGRSVISCDPTTRSDELAVPPEIAANLTLPVHVNALNIKELQKLVDEEKANTVIKQSGVKINLKFALNKKGTPITFGDKIIRNEKEIDPFIVNYDTSGEASIGIDNFVLQDGDKIKKKSGEIIENVIKPIKRKFKIEIGDIVERQLRDNDIVLFNQTKLYMY